MNKLDARVRYTRKVIEDTFLELLQDKPVSRITVTEICQRAELNRATFYKHYLDVPDLLEKIEARLLDQLQDILGNYREKDFTSMDAIREVLLQVLQFVKQGAPEYVILGSDNGDPNLPVKTFRLIYDSFFPMMFRKFPQFDRAKLEMLYYYLTLGSGGVLTTWIRNGMQESCEETMEFLMLLTIGTVSELGK